jgi:hypothetical protein
LRGAISDVSALYDSHLDYYAKAALSNSYSKALRETRHASNEQKWTIVSALLNAVLAGKQTEGSKVRNPNIPWKRALAIQLLVPLRFITLREIEETATMLRVRRAAMRRINPTYIDTRTSDFRLRVYNPRNAISTSPAPRDYE